MVTYTLKSKIYSFNPNTYEAMIEAAKNNSTPDAQRMLDGYKRKYSTQIGEYEAGKGSKVTAAANKVMKGEKTNLFKRATNYVKSHPIKSGIGIATGIGLGGAYVYNKKNK